MQLWLIVLAVAVVLLTWQLSRDNVLIGVLCGIIGLVIWGAAARASRRREPHTAWRQAQEALAAGDAVAFWKPGCGYCARLLRALRDEPRVTWVNVRVDDEANEAVRALNDGNEYTPTVLVGAQVLRNPGGREVLAALHQLHQE